MQWPSCWHSSCLCKHRANWPQKFLARYARSRGRYATLRSKVRSRALTSSLRSRRWPFGPKVPAARNISISFNRHEGSYARFARKGACGADYPERAIARTSLAPLAHSSLRSRVQGSPTLAHAALTRLEKCAPSALLLTEASLPLGIARWSLATRKEERRIDGRITLSRDSKNPRLDDGSLYREIRIGTGLA